MGNNNKPEVNLAKKGLLEIDLKEKKLKDFQRLQKIILSKNKIAEIPAPLYQQIPRSSQLIESLRELSLDHNRLTSLPAEIGCLINLRKLSLDHNLLVTVPKEMLRLQNLEKLTLNNNNLTSIPPFGSLSQLIILRLHSNRLTYIPRHIGKLRKLTEITILDNPLPQKLLSSDSLVLALAQIRNQKEPHSYVDQYGPGIQTINKVENNTNLASPRMGMEVESKTEDSSTSGHKRAREDTNEGPEKRFRYSRKKHSKELLGNLPEVDLLKYFLVEDYFNQIALQKLPQQPPKSLVVCNYETYRELFGRKECSFELNSLTEMEKLFKTQAERQLKPDNCTKAIMTPVKIQYSKQKGILYFQAGYKVNKGKAQHTVLFKDTST